MNSKSIAAYILKPEHLYKRIVDLIVSGTGEARLLGVSIEYPKADEDFNASIRREKMLEIPGGSSTTSVVAYGTMRSDGSSLFSKGSAEKKLALEDLHKFFLQKKKGKDYSPFYENLIKLYVLLCVDTKDLKYLKDGLHHYRNLVQNVDQKSLDRVLEYLVDLAERQADNAHKLAKRIAGAEQRASSADAEVPEGIMLKGMTADDSKDRANRELVVPWLKFLWESFKQILDLLHKNPKYEKTYHDICARAFKFCMENKRTQEFHKLCETLRAHLLSLKKLLNPESKAILNNINWDWSAESVKFNLNTRYLQLEVADKLEMWNEAFRTIKDIQEVIKISKKFLKNDMMDMDKYYENLAKIFYVSDNYLFHAYCLLKNYSLLFLSDFKVEMSEEERRWRATVVLLAALIVPSTGSDSHDHSVGGSSILNVQDQDSIFKENQEMATLLDFQVIPTRENLLQDIVDKGILKDAYPQFACIFDKLEKSFRPLSLPSDLKDSVVAVMAEPSLRPYGEALQKSIVVRVAQQLSRVYKQVDICKVQSVLGWTNKDPSIHFSRARSEYLPDLTYSQVEKIMIEAVVKKLLNVRVDHIKNSLIFGSESAAGLAVDERLTTFSQKMQKLQNDLGKSFGVDKKEKIDFNSKCYQYLEDDCRDFERRRELIHMFRIGLTPPTIIINPQPIPDDDYDDDIDPNPNPYVTPTPPPPDYRDACAKLYSMLKNLGDLSSSEKSKFDQLTKKFAYLAPKREAEYKKEEQRLLESYKKNKEDPKKTPPREEVLKSMKYDKFVDVCKISNDSEQQKKSIDNLLNLTELERSDIEFLCKTILAVRRQKEESRLAKDYKEVIWSHSILQMEYRKLYEASLAEEMKRKEALAQAHAVLLEERILVDKYFFGDILAINEERIRENEAIDADNKRNEAEFKAQLLIKALELKAKAAYVPERPVVVPAPVPERVAPIPPREVVIESTSTQRSTLSLSEPSKYVESKIEADDKWRARGPSTPSSSSSSSSSKYIPPASRDGDKFGSNSPRTGGSTGYVSRFGANPSSINEPKPLASNSNEPPSNSNNNAPSSSSSSGGPKKFVPSHLRDKK